MNLFFLKVSVNQIHGQVQTFRDQLELEMYLNQPVNQNRSHFFIDVLLLLQVSILSRMLTLGLKEIFEYLYCIFSTLLWILRIFKINRVYHLFEICVTSLLEFFRCTRELLSG